MTTNNKQVRQSSQELSKRLYEQHPLPGTYLESRVFFCPSTSEARLYHATTWKDGKIINCDCMGWVSIQRARRDHPGNVYSDCTHGEAVLISIAEEQERRKQHALFNPDYMQDF